MITTIPLGRRLASAIERGQHPATGEPILPDRTCGSCALRKAQTGPGHRTKCAQSAYHRGGPNLPAQTPACTLFQPATREDEMPETTPAPAETTTTPPPASGETPHCGWSDCKATKHLRLYACGVRCPLHTPAALVGQLEPDELLERTKAQRALAELDAQRAAAIAALDSLAHREQSLTATATRDHGTEAVA